MLLYYLSYPILSNNSISIYLPILILVLSYPILYILLSYELYTILYLQACSLSRVSPFPPPLCPSLSLLSRWSELRPDDTRVVAAITANHPCHDSLQSYSRKTSDSWKGWFPVKAISPKTNQTRGNLRIRFRWIRLRKQFNSSHIPVISNALSILADGKIGGM